MKDSDLWRYVTRNVTPYRPQRHPTPDPAPVPRAAKVAQETDIDPAASSRPAKRAPLPLKLGAVVAMDKRTGRRFKRGEMAIDGRIDLHGLSLDQAHAALSGFIRGAHARGARCVVVVTGKGRGGQGAGKIRREAPHWLNSPALRPLVLAVTEAQQRDGGEGALYVLLKRTRE